ncbi:MAG: hypothetical protein R3C10_26705 [Pirellulales bacterium]|nr:hypothetical protein [Planctomycetales bacterium]
MAHHSNHPQHHEKHSHDKQAKGTQLHKDWRTWTVVVLMLAAMAVYVLSLDESIGPEGEAQPAMESPAAE